MENKMKIEIWSDIVCPFCYIGKRKFETGLQQFTNKNTIEVIWKSFQLMPDMVTDTNMTVYQMLSNKHGMPLEQSVAMHADVTRSARNVGLDYNFEKAIPVNTSKAHQLIHFAHENGKQEDAEEALFYSYFTEGKNIDDIETLLEIGVTIGLDTEKLHQAFKSGRYIANVQHDINEANQIGVRGVPFFVINRKYAISGAQESNVFLETIQKAYAEWQIENPQINLEVIDGKICTIDKQCD